MSDLHYVGIIIATITGMILGALWYSPLLFGNLWMKSIGKTPETLGSTIKPIIGSIIANLLTAFGIAILFSFVGVESFSKAITIGAVSGILIIFPAMLSDNLFCGWGGTLLFIQTGYRVITVIFMSIIMYFV